VPQIRTHSESMTVAAHPDHNGLRVHDLTVEYQRGTQVLRPIEALSFDAAPGSITLLLGPSGCGKTSVLSCLGAMLRPRSGSILLEGQEMVGLTGPELTEFRRRHVGIVFQAFNLLPSLSAEENVRVVMTAAGVPRRDATLRSTELLASLGLRERMHHRPDDLSGGQQQRVAIARAVALDPKLILADEPTAHLDHGSVSSVLDLHQRLADEGRIVVVSTHDDRMLPVATNVIELAPRSHTSAQPGISNLVAGEVLFNQGDRGELVFVVNHGTFDVIRRDPDGSTVLVTQIGPGDHVGEMAPLFSLPRSATVCATSSAEVEAMTVEQFRRRFGVRSFTGRP
jgi:putative ABC transport system ATP-binding protein